MDIARLERKIKKLSEKIVKYQNDMSVSKEDLKDAKVSLRKNKKDIKKNTIKTVMKGGMNGYNMNVPGMSAYSRRGDGSYGPRFQTPYYDRDGYLRDEDAKKYGPIVYNPPRPDKNGNLPPGYYTDMDGYVRKSLKSPRDYSINPLTPAEKAKELEEYNKKVAEREKANKEMEAHYNDIGAPFRKDTPTRSPPRPPPRASEPIAPRPLPGSLGDWPGREAS